MKALLLRFVLLCFLWWVVTEGDEGSWRFGLPLLTAVTLAGSKLNSSFKWRWRPLGILRFVPFFFRQSLRGGMDVAWRALNPHMPLAPTIFAYPLRLPEGPARVFFANTVSLLPGTCSAELRSESLTIHALDATWPLHAALQSVEQRVADLFGLEIAAENSSEASISG